MILGNVNILNKHTQDVGVIIREKD